MAIALNSLPPSPSLRILKVAQADAGGPELARSSGTGTEEARGQQGWPARSASPYRGMSPLRAHPLDTPEPALQAVQRAIERRQRLEQVGTHGPQGQSCARIPTRAKVPLQACCGSPRAGSLGATGRAALVPAQGAGGL